MSNELSTEVSKDLMFDPKNLTKETIKKFLCASATDQELTWGLQVAKTCNLNPVKKEIYFVKYGNNPMSILTGYEVYLKRAERSGKYAGMRSWTEGSVEKKDLKGCVEVYVKGWEKPLVHEVDYVEYVQFKSDGTINKFWKTKPKTMIKKVAIAQGFRLAFPDDLEGMPYIDAEIDEENNAPVDNGKSRLENIIEEAEVVKTETETKTEEKQDAPKKTDESKKETKAAKKEPKPDPVKEVEEAIQAPLAKVELKEGEKFVSGFILVPSIGPKQVAGPDGKAAMKWAFTLGDSNYGTFDKKLAEELCEILYGQEKDKTQVLLNIVYKDRQGKDKVFHDIVRFEIAMPKFAE